MSNKVDWKQKYMEIRSKYMNAIDTAFRLGVQEGQRIAEMENMQMQLQQAQQQAAAAAQQAAAAQSMPGGMPGEEMPPEEGDELGQSINELEQYVKSEPKKIDFADLMKKTHAMTKRESDNISERQSKVAGILSKWEK
jgi:multidrug efflux pump subunit AcrA (membrane-fusion protein)